MHLWLRIGGGILPETTRVAYLKPIEVFMQIEQPCADKLIVHHSDKRFRGWICAALVVFALLGIIQAFRQPEGIGSEAVMGAAAACGMFVAMYLIFYEKVRFLFDCRSQRLFWSRRRAWGEKRGELAFGMIETVRTESPVGDEGIPSRRIVLVLKDGKPLPLTLCYACDGDDVQLKLAERLRVFLGQAPAADALLGEVRAAIGAGRIIEAVRLLRQAEGLSLTEARQRIDELRGE